MLDDAHKGRYQGANATVDELVPQWLKELERKGRSPRTIDEYERRYNHDIRPTLGKVKVTKVTTKMLTDLYGAHQDRGLAPSSVRKIHATISSMMSQACRWGWRENNPAEWADPPELEDTLPTVPTPVEVRNLIDAARKSQRPEHADVLYLAATTGARRGEICALRRSHVDPRERTLTVARNIVKRDGQKIDKTTKNRRRRVIALDDRSLKLLTDRAANASALADEYEVPLDPDPYLFAVDLAAAEPWDPDTISQFFGRLRVRVGYEHLEFKGLRAFMDTYGQELGFSRSQVAIRAGHDPAVAARHYTGKVPEADRRLADSMADLLMPDGPDDAESQEILG
ncbi:MAG: tyrosine-type recombinase/integrase [Actinomycetota bacterium]